MKKIELYPLWTRVWHILNGIFFIMLFASGIGLHFGITSLHLSISVHIVSGISLSILYLLFFIMNIVSGNIREYFRKPKQLKESIKSEIKYYFWDIFVKGDIPYNMDENKFGVIKQILYLILMYAVLPIIIITGLLMLFPSVGFGNIISIKESWVLALIHSISTYMIIIMFVIHLYLGTTGRNAKDFFTAIAQGWMLIEEKEPVEIDSTTIKTKKLLPDTFYNPISLLGMILFGISFLLIMLLIVVDFTIGFSSPYIGIITFILLPSIMIGSLLVIFVGAIWENKKRSIAKNSDKLLPVIDLNNKRTQKILLWVTFGGAFLVIFTVFGSFQAYEYTDSDEFCGTVCHKVMHPEFTAYKDSPHSRVGCVKCHIGSGTEWYVRSKFSGAYQVYSVIFNKYSKPIPTPVEHLRPAQQTCEQCHWPSHFNSEKKVVYDFFQSDEMNSETKMTMLVKTGGGSPDGGSQSGIHWHMNIANEIKYIATDDKRQDIPWVKSKSRITGKETIYISKGANVTNDMISGDKVRKFDCIDCHNRPSHIYNVPYKVINTYMSNNKIDKNLPYIKNLGVQVLESNSITRENSYAEIEKYVRNYYQHLNPQILIDKKSEISSAVSALNKIYLRNYFPGMNSNWKNYPNNIGHIYAKGCFRCHDGKHVSNEGKVLSHDCNVCHTIIAQQSPKQTEIKHGLDLPFIHPGGNQLNFESRLCSDCHGSKRITKLAENK